MNIVFPKNNGQHYYNIHYRYILNILRNIPEVNISLTELPEDLGNTAFKCYIDGKLVIFSFTDNMYRFGNSEQTALNLITDIPIFKFHYGVDNNFSDNVIPFTPVSFHNWKVFFENANEINYSCNSNIILNNQALSGGAKQRREFVRVLLKQKYMDLVDISIYPKLDYWKKINNCLVSVCVPGYCNNMLDRGHIQFMAFGACTISPHLPEILPFNATLIPDVHYIMCKDDYSDLISKIEWCKNNTSSCVEIGNAASKLFNQIGTPNNLWNWIIKNV